MHVDSVFSLGFMKPFPKFRFGSSSKAFGTPGPRRLVRVRRSGYGHRVRLRNEQIGLSFYGAIRGNSRFAKPCSTTSWGPGRKRKSHSTSQPDQQIGPPATSVGWLRSCSRRSTVTKRPPPPRAMGTAAGVDGAFAVAGLAWPDQRPAPGLGQPTPDAVPFVVVQCVLQAGLLDRAAVADHHGGVRLLGPAPFAFGEPQLGVLAAAQRRLGEPGAGAHDSTPVSSSTSSTMPRARMILSSVPRLPGSRSRSCGNLDFGGTASTGIGAGVELTDEGSDCCGA